MQLDRTQLARIALSQEGVREAGGNNVGPQVREYQLATWLLPAPWPWCAAFVDWCVRELLVTTVSSGGRLLPIQGNQPPLPIFRGLSPENWRPRTAGAKDLEKWARKKGLLILPESAAVEAGDIAIFDFPHCGIVVENAGEHATTLQTVEGNTNGRGTRDSESGDGVWAKRRPRSLALSFIRLELAPTEEAKTP